MAPTPEDRVTVTAEDRIEMLDELGEMEGMAELDAALGESFHLLDPRLDGGTHLDLVSQLEQTAP